METGCREQRGAEYRPCVDARELGYETARCRPWLEAACERSGFGMCFSDLVERLAYDNYRLWPGDKAAVVTEQIGDRMNLLLASGDYDELGVMSEVIGEYAKKQGIRQLIIFARRGWERTFLKDQGYKARWTVMEKTLWAE